MNLVDDRVAVNAVIPPRSGEVVTPNDAADLPRGVARGLNVNVTGDVAVILLYDSAPVILHLLAGQCHKLAVRRVRVTGTSSGITGILALY